MADLENMRAQIIANAKIMLAIPQPSPSYGSTNTLINSQADIEVAVFGQDKYTGAVMVGLKPAIEGPECATPELAIRKLFFTVCEVLALHIPKLGAHQRAVHGGGIFDEDFIAAPFKRADESKDTTKETPGQGV